MQWIIVCALALAGIACIDATCKDTRDDCMDFVIMCEFDESMQKDCPMTCGLCGTKPTVKPFPPHKGECGSPDFTRSKGKAAARGSWPWQAVLSFMGQPQCGGTLIADQWLLTSADCAERATEFPSMLKASVGMFNLNEPADSTQDVAVEKIIVAPGFDPMENLENDLALLKLAQPVTINQYVSPACLPSAYIPDSAKCFVTSYGEMRNDIGFNPVPSQGEIPVVSNDVCSDRLRDWRGPLAKSNICVGGRRSPLDMRCDVNTGAPLVCDVGGRYEVVGVFSLDENKKCNNKAQTTYGVFTKVLSFYSFITNQMEHN